MKTPKDRVTHRIKILKGQLRGLEKMVDEDKYCVDILTLSLAIQRALKELNILILEDHIKECVAEDIKKGKVNKVADELTGIFSIAQK